MRILVNNTNVVIHFLSILVKLEVDINCVFS